MSNSGSKIKLLKYGRVITQKIPFLLPILRPIKRKIIPTQPVVSFSGWGMTTQHALPWKDDDIFQTTNSHIKNHFQFNDEMGIDSTNLDILLWRHWIIKHAINHVICFTKPNEYNFVECGVADGIATYFELKEIQKNNIVDFSFHLYDSWSSMKQENLSKSEMILKGKYSSLELDRTKNNLNEFNNSIIYHKGYVPNSFHVSPESPDSNIFSPV